VTHKTAWRGKTRTIAIGPKAQQLPRAFFTPDRDDYLFNPRRVVEEQLAERSARRRAPCCAVKRVSAVTCWRTARWSWSPCPARFNVSIEDGHNPVWFLNGFTSAAQVKLAAYDEHVTARQTDSARGPSFG
jgi:hypothetical protein